jgi:hypothetical protein
LRRRWRSSTSIAARSGAIWAHSPTAVALLFMSDDKAYLDRMRGAKIQQAYMLGTVAEIRAIVAEYARVGVDELIVPDFTLGDMAQKTATLDRFIKEVAGR